MARIRLDRVGAFLLLAVYLAVRPAASDLERVRDIPVASTLRADLRSLVDRSGADYDEFRDEILARASSTEAEEITRQLRRCTLHPNQDVAIAAQILLGWVEHGSLYRRVLAELDAVDLDRVRMFHTGLASVWDKLAFRAANEWGEPIVPLAWEVVRFHGRDWPEWKVIGFLRILGAVPHAGTRQVLEHYIVDVEDPALADIARRSLERQSSVQYYAPEDD